MNHVLSRSVRCASRLSAAAAVLILASSASAAVIDLMAVGNVGNPPDPYSGSLYGSVPYAFSIGKYDVTVGQYVEFLNAKDPTGTNPLRLYTVGMSDPTYGAIAINVAAADGGKYSAVAGRGQWPATYITYTMAMRFANWMHNGQGAGDTETGAYTLGALNAAGAPLSPPASHMPGATWWVPTENEWYKAAYHRANDASAGYFEYPTSSSVIPTASMPTALANSANFEHTGGFTPATQPPLAPTPVGAYTGTTSPYGAFDMGGNVFQWTEVLACAPYRAIRGGSYASTEQNMISTARLCADPTSEIYRNMGFRLASSNPGVVAPPPPPPPVISFSFSVTVKTAGGKGLVSGFGGAIDCGKTCKATAAAGTTISMTATPDVGFRFVNWTGACVGVATTCTVQLNSSLSVQANFSK